MVVGEVDMYRWIDFSSFLVLVGVEGGSWLHVQVVVVALLKSRTNFSTDRCGRCAVDSFLP